MKIAEKLKAKDLRIQILEIQLTACKSDRKRLKEQLKLHDVVVPKGTLLINDLEDWHIKRWNNGLESGASMQEIREDMEIASKANDLNNSIKWLEK